MNELNIVFDLESPQEKDKLINVAVEEETGKKLLYKFIAGQDGTWETLKDFSTEDSIQWIPKKEGKHVIMVQAKEPNSTKSFDYVSRAEYLIGEKEEKLIKNVYLDKIKLTVGEKLNLTVEVSRVPAVFRYWIKENENWELIKDYSADNNLIWSVKDSGEHEILVECKSLESKNKFDDYKKVSFQVEEIKRLEITDFKTLVSDMFVDNELVFQVEAVHDDKRMILFKFIKINPDGSSNCIQDYSTKRMVSFVESQAGEYKLLCHAKDMYSQREYDDRALLNYKIKPYKEVAIKSFAADLSSPQVCEAAVTLKAVASGGKELLYRFRIDGNYGEDSGYTRSNTYLWNPKKPGEYIIELLVKDVSFQGSHEASATLNFKIEEQCDDPVVINEVVLDRNSKLLKGETVNIKVLASGGSELRYSFVEKKDGKALNKIDYGTCNWVNFTASEKGSHELEVRVKDKYSKREYDSHSIVHIEVCDYMPAVIEHVLSPAKENYIVGDTISYTVIAQNTKQTLLKFMLSINGQKAEETDFVGDKKYVFTPKCSGQYSLEIYARNEHSDKEFDAKKEIKLKVHDALPVTKTKIHCDQTKPSINQNVTFTVTSEGGKDVLYQFYIMNKGDWTLIQDYSKKNYYSFMPFSKGNYRILALSRSSLKKGAYEDYDILEFTVE
jgi:hypothetical protein